MNEIDRQRGSGSREEGDGNTRGGCSQEVGRMPETVKSADVISVAVNEDYSACQRDICSENLIISISCFLFFFAVMDSCFLFFVSRQPASLFMSYSPFGDWSSWEHFFEFLYT